MQSIVAFFSYEERVFHQEVINLDLFYFLSKKMFLKKIKD